MSGHNARVQPRSAESNEKRRAAMRGSKNHRYGKPAHNYKERIVHADGYVFLHAPGHPFAAASKDLVMEHRLVLEAHLRAADPDSPFLVEIDGERYLRREIEVHHIDGVKDNNELDNLQPLTKSGHAKLHQEALSLPKVCSEDGCDRAVAARGWCRHHYWLLWTKPRRG